MIAHKEIEMYRIKKEKKYLAVFRIAIIFAVAAIAMLLLACIMCMFLDTDIIREDIVFLFLMWGFTLFFVLAIVGTIVAFYSQRISRDSSREVESKVLASILKERVVQGISYNDESGVSFDSIKHTWLLSGEKYKCREHFFGKYKGVSFSASKVLVLDRGGYNNRLHRTFGGRWFIFDYEIESKLTLLMTEQTIWSRVGVKKVGIEFPGFFNDFDVFASDTASALRVFTSEVIDIIRKVKGKYKGKLMFALIDGKIHFGINNSEDYLLFPLSTPVDDNYIEKMERRVDIIAELIDDLKDLVDALNLNSSK